MAEGAAADILIETAKDNLSLTTTLRPPDEIPDVCMDSNTAGMLFVKVGLLEQDLERFSEGIQGLVGEAEGVIGGIFERVAILHARTARIEMMLGLPVFGEDDDEEGMNSPRASRPGSPSSPRVARDVPRGGGGGRTCRRGHPLRKEEASEDDPPRVCGFCRQSRPVSHVCSEGTCYFSACAECMAPAPEEGPGAAPDDDEEPPRIVEVAEGEELPPLPADPDEEDLAREYLAAAAAAGYRPHELDGRTPSDLEDHAMRRSWPAGPADACNSNSAAQSGRATPVEEPCPPNCGGPRRPSAFAREPATPSTDIPGDDGPSSHGSPWVGDDMPLPPGSEDSFGGAGRRRRCAGDGGGATMKVRLAQLEGEVRELERRLAEGSVSSGSPGAAPHVGDLEQVVARLLSEESQRLHDSLRAELERATSESAAGLAAATPALKKECKAAAMRAGEALRTELCGRIDEVLSQVQAQQVAFSNVFEAALKKDLRAEFADGLRGLGDELRGGGAAEVNAKLEGLDARLSADVYELSTRLAGLEGELPRGRVRAAVPRPPSPAPSSRACGDGEVVDGLAQGVTALARAMGLLAEHERLGDGEGWQATGRRLEKAWAARARDFWQYGVPGQPHLFDILRQRCAASTTATPAPSPSATSLSGAPPLPLPDRREGARLASRLAAAVAFGSSAGSRETSHCSEDEGPPQPRVRREGSASSRMASPDASARSTRKTAAAGFEAWGQDPFLMTSPGQSPTTEAPPTPGLGRPPTPKRREAARRETSTPQRSPPGPGGGVRRQGSVPGYR